MQAGQLRERITIQGNSPSQDAYGQLIAAWGTVATVWAKVRQASGSERFEQGADQVQAVGYWEITVRYRGDITTQMRVQWRGQNMNIVQVDPQRASGRMVLRCENVE